MKVGVLLIWILMYGGMCRPIEVMEEEVGQKIFHEDHDYIIYVDATNNELSDEFRKYCNQATHGCAIMSPDIEEFSTFYAFFGVKQLSYYAIINPNDRKKFVMEQPPTEQNFRKFWKGFKQGTLENYYSSEQIPQQQQQQKTVKKVVGKTFKKFISQPGRDAVVFFTANKDICHECWELEEGYQKVAERLNSKTFVFGKVDRVQNDHPDMNQDNVPVVKVYFRDGQVLRIEKFDEQELDYKLSKASQKYGGSSEL